MDDFGKTNIFFNFETNKKKELMVHPKQLFKIKMNRNNESIGLTETFLRHHIIRRLRKSSTIVV